MGEAKRRKQLGLMPTVFPFEAELDNEAKATIIRGLDDASLREQVVRVLQDTQLSGEGWASEYRSAFVFSGRQRATLYSAEDVQGIPVPPLRRLTGEVVLNKSVADVEPPALGIPGGVVRLREQRHSFDGQHWDSFPAIRDGERVRRILDEHPAFNLEGESLGQYRVEQFAEGRIDVDPEPPAGALEVLEEIGREWHGDTPEKWAQFHADMLGAQEVDPDAPPPALKRTYFELRKPAPLQNPTRNLLAVRSGLEVYLLTDPTYSPDGEMWFSYDDPNAEVEEDDLLQAFSDLLNMETVSVTVFEDGRIEWEEGDIPDEHAERVRADLRGTTGAGNPEAWAAWTRQMLVETFNAEGGETPQEMPVPQAVRLDLAKDAITDPDPLAQTFIESEVTFDGAEWRDLYDEEMPPELLLAIANMKPNPGSAQQDQE